MYRKEERRSLQDRLPGAYRRWPWLAGVAAGLWILVVYYLLRLVYSFIQGNRRTALFSLLWSAICFILWNTLHNWARRQRSD